MESFRSANVYNKEEHGEYEEQLKVTFSSYDAKRVSSDQGERNGAQAHLTVCLMVGYCIPPDRLR